MPLENDHIDRCLVAFERWQSHAIPGAQVVVFHDGQFWGVFINLEEANRCARHRFGRGNYLALRVE